MRSPSARRVAVCVLLVGTAMAGTAGVAIAVEAAAPAEVADPAEAAPLDDAAVSVGNVSTAGEARASIPDADPDVRQVDLAGFDRSVIGITVDGAGRGVWTLRYERTLRNESERDDFRTFAERFNEEETELYRNFQADATALAGEGENVTDREMAAANFSRSGFVDSEFGTDVGVVELSFAWRGFAAVDEDAVTVGDVFEGGFYLGPDQELVVRPGADLSFVSRDPEGTPSNPDSIAESASITWQGERRFTDRRPRVVFARNATAGTDDGATSGESPDAATTTLPAGATDDANASSSPTGAAGTGGNSNDPLVWGVLGAAVVLAAAIAIRTRSSASFASRNDDRLEPASGTSVTADEATTGGPSTGGSTAGEDVADAAAIREAELLSDEDRIEAILRDHGGRVKQSRIVEETDWSKSKVSVVLSGMAEDGTVSKLRIGRENVVTLEEDGSDEGLPAEE